MALPKNADAVAGGTVGGRSEGAFSQETALKAVTMFRRTAMMAGKEPEKGANVEFLMQAGWLTITTNGAGQAFVPFPTGFPGGLLTVVATPRRQPAVAMSLTGTFNGGGFGIEITPASSISFQVQYVAVGF